MNFIKMNNSMNVGRTNFSFGKFLSLIAIPAVPGEGALDFKTVCVPIVCQNWEESN